jgi:hypothetical protein
VIDAETVLALHHQGLSAKQIAAQMGCTTRTVTRIRARNGLSAALPANATHSMAPERAQRALPAVIAGEEWRPVDGAHYEVSNLGNLRRGPQPVQSRATYPGRPVKRSLNGGGRVIATLTLPSGKQKTFMLHRLVAAAFLGQPPEGMPLVRHLDGDPGNNTVGNLKYGTAAENTADMMAHGHSFWANRTACSSGHKYTEANTYVTPAGHRQCKECARTSSRETARRKRARELASR